MESVSQETNIKFTSRQLAPSFESEKRNLAGNLGKKLSLTNKEIEKSDLIDCPDYINSSNPNIPEHIFEILKNHKNIEYKLVLENCK